MKDKLKFTKFQKIIEICCAIVILYLFGFMIFKWNTIPNKIPSHFNFEGIADAWKNKSFILFVPIVVLILYILLTAVSFFPSVWNIPSKITQDNKLRVYNSTRDLLCVIKLEITIMFAYIAICSAKSKCLGSEFTLLYLISVFSTIVIYFIVIVKKAKPKS